MAIEAAALLLLIRVGLMIVPLPMLRRWSCPRQMHAIDAGTAVPVGQRIGAIVAAVARRVPTMTCLVQALAAESMLRRRGYAPTLKLGVRAPTEGVRLDAHAWVECAGVVVVGNRVKVSDYVVLTANE